MNCIRHTYLLPKYGDLLRAVHRSPLTLISRNFRPEPCQSEKMTDIGTRRIFTPEHDMFRETARKFFREQIVPYHEQWEEDGQVSRECWLKAGESGLLGINIPSEKGGLGADWKTSAVGIEEAFYANCSGPGFSAHSELVMPYISTYGTKEQIEKYIPDMTAGRKIGAIAFTERNAGSDLQAIQTHAKPDGNDWILNGSKTIFSNGYMCDVVVVAAMTKSDRDARAHGMSLFLVNVENPGVKMVKKLKNLGLKAQDAAELFFDDCRLPREALLGDEEFLNRGFHILMTELQQERLGVGIASVAMCEAAFEEAREYVKQRRAFGKKIADLQTILHELAELKTEIASARAFVDQCIELHNVKKLDGATASMAKYYSSNLAASVTSRCLQMFGGWGYMWEYPMAKRLVDARLQSIYAGTNEIMKELIARRVVK